MRRPGTNGNATRLVAVVAVGILVILGVGRLWKGGLAEEDLGGSVLTQSKLEVVKVQKALESLENRLLRIESKLDGVSSRSDASSPGSLTSKQLGSVPDGLGSSSIKPITMEWAQGKVAALSETKIRAIQQFYSHLSIPSVTEPLRSGDVVVDIGANLGKFSQQIRQMCPGCIIVAFEALPDYAAYMKSKVQSGEQTHVFAFGLSNSKSKAKFFTDDSNLGWNTLVGSMTQPSMKQVEVDLVRLDDVDFNAIVPDFFSRVKLVKIDTEGAEGFVIAGGHAFFESLNPKPPIYLEVAWGAGNSPNWAHATQQFEWLFAHGYNRFDYASIRGTVDVIVRPS